MFGKHDVNTSSQLQERYIMKAQGAKYQLLYLMSLLLFLCACFFDTCECELKIGLFFFCHYAIGWYTTHIISHYCVLFY